MPQVKPPSIGVVGRTAFASVEHMPSIYPPKFRSGDLVRVVAPALSRAVVTEHDNTSHIERRFAEMGLRLSFGEHVDEMDGLLTSSVQSRVDDLHAAFSDQEVAGILTVIGGFSSNELLRCSSWRMTSKATRPHLRGTLRRFCRRLRQRAYGVW